MGEPDLGLAIFWRDVENEPCVDPFVFVLHKIDGAFGYEPDDPFFGYELHQFLLAVMEIFVAIGEFLTGSVRLAFDLSRPPCPYILDGIEGLPWGLIDQDDSAKVLLFHDCVFFYVKGSGGVGRPPVTEMTEMPGDLAMFYFLPLFCPIFSLLIVVVLCV